MPPSLAPATKRVINVRPCGHKAAVATWPHQAGGQLPPSLAFIDLQPVQSPANLPSQCPVAQLGMPSFKRYVNV